MSFHLMEKSELLYETPDFFSSTEYVWFFIAGTMPIELKAQSLSSVDFIDSSVAVLLLVEVV